MACVSRLKRAQWGHQGSEAHNALVGLRRFKADLDRLPQRVTREDLAVVLGTVYRRGYLAGRSMGSRERAEAA